MIVVVAEKPSVGRDIAKVLGASERGEGFLRGERYTVTWAIGHLCALKEPDELDARYKSWRMEDLPILPSELPAKVLPKTKKQFTVIKTLLRARDTERVICATDAGREGEYIFRLIYQLSGCTKPVDRLWISSMTAETIREGFSALKPSSEYDGLYRSAACRSQADWLVGMNATRAYTLAHGALLSVGRVQTPTLAILVKRRAEIEAFVPEQYYTVTADFGDYKGLYQNPEGTEEGKRARVPTREAADAIAADVRGQTARVDSVRVERKSEPAPQLFDLTALQREANRTLGFTAKRTLATAQALYEERKAITYPRTDSRYLPAQMSSRVKETLTKLAAPFDALANQALELNPSRMRRVFDDQKVSDHHAIIPTPKTISLDALKPDEAALYDMIARRFCAAFYPACDYLSARVITKAKEHAFLSTGRTEINPGWRRAYPSMPSKESPLPPLKEGDTRAVKGAQVKQETTKPPAQHTDASLLGAMENAGRDIKDEQLREQMKGMGLGTPATRAAIIERLLSVGYAQRKGKAITATDKGVALIALTPEAVKSPETTGKWELALHNIAQGERQEDRFLQGIRELSAFLVRDAAEHAHEGGILPEEARPKRGRKKNVQALKDVRCPLCGGAVTETALAFGCAKWREGCAFTLWKNALENGGGPALNAPIVTRLLQTSAVRGSTGTVTLENGLLCFTKTGESAPSVRRPIKSAKKS